MKKHIRFSILAALVSVAMPAAHAAALTGAKITHIVKDVKTVAAGKVPRPSALNEFVDSGKAVRTGIDSRTELLFSDQTITRLGANSHFSFNEGAREISLSQGAILLQVPKGAGGAKIQTAAVTAAITGTTILLEVGPRFTKLIVIEGECILTPKAGGLHRGTVVKSGQQVNMSNKATQVPAPFAVNLSELMKTSLLLTGEWGARLEQKLIAAAIASQAGQHVGEIGTLKVKGTVLVNKKPAKSGAEIHSGDIIQTAADQTAIIILIGGGEISIEVSTRVRIGGGGNEPVTINIVFGHAETHGQNNPSGGDGTGAESLPYFAAFGFGNFPAGGGGGSSSSGGSAVTVVLPGGLIVFLDSLGRFIR